MSYPVFIYLEQASCLVVGAGSVGCRKISGLLRAGAKCIHVVAPYVSEEFQIFENKPEVTLWHKKFAKKDVAGHLLVFAATNKREINASVVRECQKKNILCSVADAPEESSFIIPASIDFYGLQVAIASGSPALSARIKNEFEAWLGKRHERQIMFLSRLRPIIISLSDTIAQEKRSDILKLLSGQELENLLNVGDREACYAFLKTNLPPILHEKCLEIINELV